MKFYGMVISLKTTKPERIHTFYFMIITFILTQIQTFFIDNIFKPKARPPPF